MKTLNLRIFSILVFFLMFLPSDLLYIPNILTVYQFAFGLFFISFHFETLLFCIFSLGGIALMLPKNFLLNAIGGFFTILYLVYYIYRIPADLSPISIISICIYLTTLGFFLVGSKKDSATSTSIR